MLSEFEVWAGKEMSKVVGDVQLASMEIAIGSSSFDFMLRSPGFEIS